MLIEQINSPKDIKKISIEELPTLADEIRKMIIKKTSLVGGHVGSNLGIVELTIALHYVFDSPVDKIVFDVSHQSYVHKILTGRKRAFLFEDEYKNVSGYTNPLESEHDCFNVGHTSTSISLACGLAKGRDVCGREENIIAVIGDASLDGGEAFEALNCAGELNTGLIVVVNDNDMSIPENHGALSRHLSVLRENKGKAKNNFFETLGFSYDYVENGHNIADMINALQKVKNTKKPVVVHCHTKKGKGYSFAEDNQEKWHWAHPYNVETGEFHKKTSVPKENYGAIVGAYLEEKMKKDASVVAITASVPAYIGFHEKRRKEAGSQYLDVGIAEQNAVTLSAALAKSGCKPVLVTGSSFYQRTYDQIEQEMCINRCAATMLIAFSGIYGHDSDAHAGLYDISLLCNVPNLVYLAPSNKQDYLAMLDWSIEQNKCPVAIRIPWNGVHYTEEKPYTSYEKTRYRVVAKGSRVAIMGLGSFFQLGQETSELLKETYGINVTLIDPMFASGYDRRVLERLKDDHELVVTLEDGLVFGGFGSRISQYYGCTEMKVLNCGFTPNIPTTFSAEQMLIEHGLTAEAVASQIIELIGKDK